MTEDRSRSKFEDMTGGTASSRYEGREIVHVFDDPWAKNISEDAAWEEFSRWLAPQLLPGVAPRRLFGSCWLIDVSRRVDAEETRLLPVVTYVRHPLGLLHRITYTRYRGALYVLHEDSIHRRALHVGEPLPELHHVCRVQGCYNPWHLTPLLLGDHAALHQAIYTFFDYTSTGRQRIANLYAECEKPIFREFPGDHVF